MHSPLRSSTSVRASSTREPTPTTSMASTARSRRWYPKATIEPYVFWRLARGMRSEGGNASQARFQDCWSSLGRQASREASTTAWRWRRRPVRSEPTMFRHGPATGSPATPSRSRNRNHGLFAEYNYASGDADPTDQKREGFDQLYPTPHDKYGLADQVGWKNIHDLRAGLETEADSEAVVDRVLSLVVAGQYVMTDSTTLRGALVARVADGTAGRHVGQEADFQAIYALNASYPDRCRIRTHLPGNVS